MQSYTEIPGNKPVKDSRTLILNNDKTIASHYAGTAFPTTNLIVGMECYRTDLGLKYRLTSTSPVNWEPVLKAAEIAKVKVNNAAQADKATNADTAANANKLIGKNWYWSGQGGQPAWLWGGSDGANMYVYNPANFRVANANTIGDLGVGGTVNNVANKIVRTQGNGYAMFGYINCNIGVENGNITNVIYDNGDGYYRKCSLAHLASKITAVGGGSSNGSKTFTSSGSFTVPAGVNAVFVTAIGGGGGALRFYQDQAIGGNGGRVWRRCITVTPGSTIAITIGAGGAYRYVTNSSGNPRAGTGGVTSFGNLLSVAGGEGGGCYSSNGANANPQEFYNIFAPYGNGGTGTSNGNNGIMYIEW